MATLTESMYAMLRTVNHLTFEIGALRRELAQRGLAKESARGKQLSPGLAQRLYSHGPRPSSASSAARKKSSARQSRRARRFESPGLTID